MDSIGAEVGQKMRSAIKAKLLELNCYVDDELPDYIMVMVANKRTKSQMNEDLNLFLSAKTSTFVEWLHIVLKKLKEVTVTNPEAYKKSAKRKSGELPNAKVKKEKREIGLHKNRKATIQNLERTPSKSLTDNLPVSADQLSEQRRISNENKNHDNIFDDNFDIPLLAEVNMSNEQDLQYIEKKIRSVKSRLGLLVDSDLEEELPEIKSEDHQESAFKHKKLKNPDYRTVHVQDEPLPESNSLNSPEENVAKCNENSVSGNNTNGNKKNEHKRITFEDTNSQTKPSILERLGHKSNKNHVTSLVKPRISVSEFRKDEEPFLKYFRENNNEERDRPKEKEYANKTDRRVDKSRREGVGRSSREWEVSKDRRRERFSETRSETKKESILSRLGVMSKVTLPQKEPEESEPEDELKTRKVRSMVQVKPRVIPSGTPQPNKNLLLKAVAEAQRSVAQTAHVGCNSKFALLANKSVDVTTRNKEKSGEDTPTAVRKFSQREKTKLKNLILTQTTRRDKQSSSDDDNKAEEYIPEVVKNKQTSPKYVPSKRQLEEDASSDDNKEMRQQFIVTLAGIKKCKLSIDEPKPSVETKLKENKLEISKANIKSRLEKRKSPSPIIFDKVTAKVTSKHNVPDKLPIVHPPLSIKNKERCKYWPSCRQGDKCEFVHPNTNCEMFPHCKFGDNCLYLHPTCKFGSSCTKRECPYSHTNSKSTVSRSTGNLAVNHVTSGLQTCKFFPKCANVNCPFYHPKLCKFGKYCKNITECTFSHTFSAGKKSLIWHSK